VTRIVCVSDTHNRHERVRLPEGDVLIHAGDLTMRGRRDEIYRAFEWLSKQPHRRIVVIPGNHDRVLQNIPQLSSRLRSAFPRVELLIDQETVVFGMRVYGSPWQPWFNDWAYNFETGRDGDKQAEDTWAKIPDDTTILVTHGPAFDILDTTIRREHVGCVALRARISQLKNLRLHVFGHVHEGYGFTKRNGVLFVNASACGADYSPIRQPLVVTL
jgi:Icc-related predicted phosphoesterase